MRQDAARVATNGPRSPWVAASARVLIALGFPGVAALAQAAVSPFVLPAPTGPFAVGQTSWHVTDSARPDGFNSNGESRAVEVVAWYPTAAESGKGRPRATYLHESIAEVQAFAQLIRQPRVYDAVAAVATHATVDAPPLPGKGPLPVLVFSHGYTGVASAYTALLEDLASHGYAVLSVVHPYEVAAARLPGGGIVTMLDANNGLRGPAAAVQAEWSDEDRVMQQVTGATDEETRLRVLRTYLHSLANTDRALARWVEDEQLVLNRLTSLRKNTVAGQLAARLDQRRIGVFGHSMGGVTAGQFCIEDPRCRAGLNLDGIPQYGTMIDASMTRPFLMVYSARAGRLGASDAIYARATTRYVRVDVAGTMHLDFSDMNFWRGPLRTMGAYGTIAPERAATLTRQIVREYFDQELLGRPSPLLNGTRREPEVRVVRGR